MKQPDRLPPSPKPFDLDLDALLHPAQAFAHPRDVVADADLTLNEKRAILASWASDACAVEAAPALRHLPGGDRPVPIDDILLALQQLDREATALAGASATARVFGRGAPGIGTWRARALKGRGTSGRPAPH